MAQEPFLPQMIILSLTVLAMVSQNGDDEEASRPSKTLEVRTRECTTPVLHTTKGLATLNTSLDHRSLRAIQPVFIQAMGSTILRPL